MGTMKGDHEKCVKTVQCSNEFVFSSSEVMIGLAVTIVHKLLTVFVCVFVSVFVCVFVCTVSAYEGGLEVYERGQ